MSRPLEDCYGFLKRMAEMRKRFDEDPQSEDTERDLDELLTGLGYPPASAEAPEKFIE